MGRGNVCTFGKYEGLFYIDKDYINVYYDVETEDNIRFGHELSFEEMTSGAWKDDMLETEIQWNYLLEDLQNDIGYRFKSFESCDMWLGDDHAILENNLFYIAITDNEWSYAVKLIQKEDDYGCLEGFQKKHYKNYLEGIKEILLDMFPTVGTYASAWTNGTIKGRGIRSFA